MPAAARGIRIARRSGWSRSSRPRCRWAAGLRPGRRSKAAEPPAPHQARCESVRRPVPGGRWRRSSPADATHSSRAGRSNQSHQRCRTCRSTPLPTLGLFAPLETRRNDLGNPEPLYHARSRRHEKPRQRRATRHAGNVEAPTSCHSWRWDTPLAGTAVSRGVKGFRSLRLFIHRPALSGRVPRLDVARVLEEQERNEDPGDRASHVGKIGHAARIARLAERAGPQPDL